MVISRRDALKAALATVGVLTLPHAVVACERYVLVAGAARVNAVKTIGWKTCSFRVWDQGFGQKELVISDILVPDTHRQSANLDLLVNSIKRIGLIEPPIVCLRKDYQDLMEKSDARS